MVRNTIADLTQQLAALQQQPASSSAGAGSDWQQVFNDITAKVVDIEQRLDTKFHDLDAMIEELRS